MSKIALVHDYLTQQGGAERVFELLCSYFPYADIYTSIYNSKSTIPLQDREVKTSKLQNIPLSGKFFRLFAPFYYDAFESLDLQAYDLIISSNSAFAKAVKKGKDAKHICLCHNITRFLWDTEIYLSEYQQYKPYRKLISKLFQNMRYHDLVSSRSPDVYIANSSTVKKRIHKIYDRESQVINFPINSSKFTFSNTKEEFYLVASRLLSYKRIDVIVEAFNWLGLPLIIIGDGPEKKKLQARALENITFLGHVTDVKRNYLMANARFVIIAALEDYGLVPIEANVSGTPAICYGAGGVLDTQVPGITGVFFNRQTPDSLQQAVCTANKIDWNYMKIHDHAVQNFSEDTFFKKLFKVINSVCGTSVHFGEDIHLKDVSEYV